MATAQEQPPVLVGPVFGATAAGRALIPPISPSYVHRLVSEGRITPSVVMGNGRTRLFSVSDLQRLALATGRAVRMEEEAPAQPAA